MHIHIYAYIQFIYSMHMFYCFKDMQGMPAYLSRLDSTDGGFVETLQKLDKISNRSRDTVFIFYVKSGQTKVSDILDNTVSK